MIVTLKCGESVSVRFEDTDGEIAVTYDERSVRVETNLPDDQDRMGVIYEEKWRGEPRTGSTFDPEGSQIKRARLTAADLSLRRWDYDDRPVDSYPPLGLRCVVCDEPQYGTPGGATCMNGHGGADGKPSALPAFKPGYKQAAEVDATRELTLQMLAELKAAIEKGALMPVFCKANAGINETTLPGGLVSKTPSGGVTYTFDVVSLKRG